MFINVVRKLRHGPLNFLSPLWIRLGSVYQNMIQIISGLKTKQYINKYGPFKLDAKFAFSDFEH